jgi:hypothetical protein
MEELRHRQVHGEMAKGEGEVPPVEQTPSCAATFYNEVSRGTKFDDSAGDIQKETPMPEESTSRTR